jgi:transposase
LLKASFIPLAPQRALRDLVRYRIQLIQERTREVNRIQKVGVAKIMGRGSP